MPPAAAATAPLDGALELPVLDCSNGLPADAPRWQVSATSCRTCSETAPLVQEPYLAVAGCTANRMCPHSLGLGCGGVGEWAGVTHMILLVLNLLVVACPNPQPLLPSSASYASWHSSCYHS